MKATTAKNFLAEFDWLLILALLGLMAVGVAFIYSATMVNPAAASAPFHRQLWFKQGVWGAIGLVCAGLVCAINYQRIARFALIFYWTNILFLAAVLIPGIGSMRYGARRWIDLGFFQFQPSEFAKLSLIFALGHFLSRPKDELRQGHIFFKALGMIVLPFLLVFKEPDLGSALLLLPVGLAMMFVAGVPAAFLTRLLGGMAALIALVLVDILYAPKQLQLPVEEYQRRRLLVFFGRDFAAPDATEKERLLARVAQRSHSYNVEQAMISVGSGGLTGKGWMRGTQNALGYLPRAVAHNDFIFSVIAEESGFVGSVIVVTLYTVVLFVGIRIASEARDRLGKLLAVGVVTLLGCHVFINIGMNIRLMPVTGVPLPLLSYGGSSVLCSLIAAGLLQNVHIHRRS
ncbi:rod shape-determining protein RodA [Verrucomicrobiota bacterium]|nr:rod shape-determining protein RodA [Verrucomicrobiota bacterium]